MSEDTGFATKEYVRNEIQHLTELVDEKFSGRDKAIELLASKAPLFLAIAAFLLALASYLKPH